MTHTTTLPKHRRTVSALIYRDGVPVADPSTEARCTCSASGYHTCPRHTPVTYTDQQARHATDSIAARDRLFVGWHR